MAADANRTTGLFIVGVDTGVGKTHVAAMIARRLVAAGRRVGVYKPAASGCRRRADGELASEDAEALWEAAGRPARLDDVCPQRFAAPLAPPAAARREGRLVDRRLLRTRFDFWRRTADFVLVEGAGGLLSPISDEDCVADLAVEFRLPLVVVAANRLGVINQTLQTLMTAAHYRGGLWVAGVVLNEPTPPDSDDASRASNPGDLAARCPSSILEHVRWGQTELREPIDWEALARL